MEHEIEEISAIRKLFVARKRCSGHVQRHDGEVFQLPKEEVYLEFEDAAFTDERKDGGGGIWSTKWKRSPTIRKLFLNRGGMLDEVEDVQKIRRYSKTGGKRCSRHEAFDYMRKEVFLMERERWC